MRAIVRKTVPPDQEKPAEQPAVQARAVVKGESSAQTEKRRLMTPTLGELVRMARRAAGWTQESLAERSVISVRTLADIEAGRQRRPRHDTLEDILRALAPELTPVQADAIRAAWRGSPDVEELPLLLDPFVGRERELALLRRLLHENRLVTLCGLAGVGKTRLALAATAPPQPFERVVFVGLSGTVRNDDVAAVALARVGGRPVRDDAPATLARALRGSRMLVIIDSAEHVRAGVTALVEALLAVDGPTLLVTSQLPLSIRMERLMIVEPLRPDDALRLLLDRAERAGAAAIAADERLAAICERLDRLPLAIELAAPKLRTLTAAMLLERLNGGAGLLSADGRGHRYPTLHAALAWNYAQLGAGEQRVLRALATFAGSWPLTAAEDLCGRAVVEPLDRLVAANFITRMETPNGNARYWVLGVIRDYVREILSDTERDEFERLHVACAAQLVRRYTALYADPAAAVAELDAALAQTFDACIEDVFAAAEAARRLGLRTAGIEIVAGLHRYWPTRGRATWAARLLRELAAEAEEHGDVPAAALAHAFRARLVLDRTADVNAI